MKLLKVFLIVTILFLFLACQNKQKNILNKLLEYRNKINAIIEEESQDSFQIVFTDYSLEHIFTDDSPFDQSENMKTREELLEVYDLQRDNTNDVRVDETLYPYKDLLDQVIDLLKEEDVILAIAYVNIDFGGYGSIETAVSMSPDEGILLKMDVTINEEEAYFGIKLGYEEENFYIREYSENTLEFSFDYFEFLENNHLINIMYANNDYWYQYRNQNDNTDYSISHTSEGNTLRWFNPQTMIRTTLCENEGNYNLFELFNEKGIIFSYEENLDVNEIKVAWQLLEATGWDNAYVSDIPSPYKGVYKNNIHLFEDEKINSTMNENFANLRLQMTMTKAEFTDSILNLSAYNLDFQHPELSIEIINFKIASAMSESTGLSVYHNLDFLSDNIQSELYSVIDANILPNNKK